MRIKLMIAMVLLIGLTVQAKDKDSRGLLPEVNANSKDESLNEKKSYTSELLITKTETKAIEALQNLIQRKKGQPEEADLQYRLAELYMRRSKSGRFFDLYMSEKTKQLTSIPKVEKSSQDWIRKSVAIYFKIETQFKDYKEMDSVLFNNAFANQQLGLNRVSENLYQKLIKNYPESELRADSLLALSELLYDQARFTEALDNFKILEKYSESRVYSYGMYKMAWTFYNLKKTNEAIVKLTDVLKLNPSLPENEAQGRGYYLRKEALRDLALFVGDSYKADELYSFLSAQLKDEELGSTLMLVTQLYASHNREKEMNIFLDEFIKKNEKNPFLVKSHLALVEANETLKQREKVIEHLNAVNALCKPGSPWRLAQSHSGVEGSCSQDFRRTSLDIARKWWDVWLKNKQHNDFSVLTEKALRLVLENDSLEKPDVKTRYALAELLVQQNRFEEASDEYKTVSEKSADLQLAHDAHYAALYSKEKSLELKKDLIKSAQRKSLALSYLKKYPNGQHFVEVQFQVALNEYEEKNFDASLLTLNQVAANKSKLELRAKAEDLILDIYNLKKDFVELRKRSQLYSQSETRPARLEVLKKINEEAHYSEIQSRLDQRPKAESIEQLISFAEQFPKSNLAQSCLWQALSLSYSEGRAYPAALLTLKYYEKYPQDEKNLEALKEAAKSFAESGRILKSIEVLKILTEVDKANRLTHQELSADLYVLEKKYPEARQLYNLVLTQVSINDRARVFSKILETFEKKQNDPQYVQLQKLILEQNIEPYATEILSEKAKLLLSSKNFKEAFEQARKIMSRNVPAEHRAPARLVQAQVLEQEMISQSVKSSKEDRLGIVLAMKTEKLDKALTAYLSATKMTTKNELLGAAYQGIDRLYQNYIESLSTIIPPPSLSEADQKALKDELAKILQPVQEKRVENQKIAAAYASATLRQDRVIAWADFPLENTVQATTRYPSAEALSNYFPKNLFVDPSQLEALTKDTKKKCQLQKWKELTKKELQYSHLTNDVLLACYQSQDYVALEEMALDLAGSKKFLKEAWFLLSLTSENKNFKLKSLWFIDQALKLDNNNPVFNYQKARIQYHLDSLDSAKGYFAKAIESSMSSTEIDNLRALKFYSENQYENALQIFSRIPKNQLYNLESGLAYSEALARKGDVQKALAVIDELLKVKTSDLTETYLQQAHLFERYKLLSKEATASYEKALKQAKDQEQKKWIERKIDYLNSLNKKVGAHVISGD
jgi:tetratricopeptide (TPR) repeat protein